MDGEQTYNGLLLQTTQTLANPLPKGSCIDCCQSSQALSQDEHAKHQALHWLLQEYLLQRGTRSLSSNCKAAVKSLVKSVKNFATGPFKAPSAYFTQARPFAPVLLRNFCQFIDVFTRVMICCPFTTIALTAGASEDFEVYTLDKLCQVLEQHFKTCIWFI